MIEHSSLGDTSSEEKEFGSRSFMILCLNNRERLLILACIASKYFRTISSCVSKVTHLMLTVRLRSHGAVCVGKTM